MAQHRQSFQSQPCDSVASRKTFALRFKHSEMTYNLGLAFLQAKKPREAFQTLAQVVPDFKSNPCLWLHLAECCVALNAEENDVRIAGALYGNSDSTEQVWSLKPNSILLTFLNRIGVCRKCVFNKCTIKVCCSCC